MAEFNSPPNRHFINPTFYNAKRKLSISIHFTRQLIAFTAVTSLTPDKYASSLYAYPPQSSPDAPLHLSLYRACQYAIGDHTPTRARHRYDAGKS